MKTKLLELIDFEKVDILLEGFNKTTGFVTAILDLNGNVLSKSGWRQMCTDFHRINPETSKKCTISDTELAGKLAKGEKYHFYKCLNGLVDVAVPIVINGERIANLFSGQFFFEEPDRMFFKKQAEKYGFDEEKYMEALTKVPVISKEKVLVAMDFLLNMTQIISEMIFQKLEQTEINKALKESEEEYRNLIKLSPVAMAIVHDWKTIYLNPAAVQLFGAKTQNELLGKHVYELVHPDFQELAIENAKLLAKNGYVNMQEQKYVKLDGSVLDVETQAKLIRFNNNPSTLVVINDITERKKAERALVHSHDLMRYVIENNNGAIAIHDKDLKYIYVSQRYLHDYKVKEKDIIGKHHYDVFPDLPQKWRDVHQKALSGVISSADNDTYLREDGTLEWTRWECRPWYEADGSIGGIIIYTEVITDRMQTEADLRKSEENLSITLHSIGDAVISTDKAGLIVQMNPVAEKICGWKLSEALGKPLHEVFKIINAETREAVPAPVNKVLEIGEVVGLANHTVLISKNGTEYQIADSAAPIKNKEGETTGVVLVFSDVTEKYLDQKRIKDSEERFALVLDALEQGIWDWNVITNEVFYSEQWKKQIGYKDDELKNDFNTWIEHLHPEEKEDCQNAVNSYLRQPFEHFMLEFRFRHKDGSYRWIHNIASSLKNKEGKVIRMFGTHTDITERKQAELIIQRKTQEIELNNQRLESLLKISQFQTNSIQELLDLALSEAIELTNSKIGYIYFYNEANKQFILNTWSKDVMKECNVMNPQTVYDLDKTGCWGEAVRQRKPIILNDYQAENPHKRGTPEGHVQLSKFLTIPVIIDNRIVAVAGVANKEIDYDNSDIMQLTLLMDSVWKISERISLIKDLIMAKEKAEESDKLKSAFLANMSHEIRTPMNGIMGFAELLKNPGLTGDKQQEYIAIIEKSGNRMLNIINNIVDISKIEAGLMMLDIKESNINEQIEYIHTFFKPEVEAKGMKLTYTSPLPSKEAILKTDREKVYAILTNLVKNAIKYCNSGSIEIGYDVVETMHESPLLQFYVKDTGIGIPEDRQEAIFERFIQADINDEMAHQGAGLGLAITRSYVEMLGGKVWVESKVGLGSTFYFTLPYNFASKKDAAVPDFTPSDKSDSFRKLKILIVEDDIASELFLGETLKIIDGEVINARTGFEAIEACKKNHDIDLILMDIKMPEMGGDEATRQIRKFNKEVIIIAQTAYGLSGDRDKAIEAGCNDYLVKPINKDKLFALIHKHYSN